MGSNGLRKELRRDIVNLSGLETEAEFETHLEVQKTEGGVNMVYGARFCDLPLIQELTPDG
jgi:hypothetical protein